MTSSSNSVETISKIFSDNESQKLWLNFISKVLDSITWPLIIFIIFLILKKQIIELIPSLKKISAKGFEFEFSKELVRIQENTIYDGSSISAQRLAFNPDLQKWYEQTKEVISTKPGYGVSLAYSELENTIRNFAKLYDPGSKTPKLSYRPMNMLLEGLSKVIDISPNEQRNILNLEKLRNKAMSDAKYMDTISSIDAFYYLDLVVEMILYITNLNPQGPVPDID